MAPCEERGHTFMKYKSTKISTCEIPASAPYVTHKYCRVMRDTPKLSFHERSVGRVGKNWSQRAVQVSTAVGSMIVSSGNLGSKRKWNLFMMKWNEKIS